MVCGHKPEHVLYFQIDTVYTYDHIVFGSDIDNVLPIFHFFTFKTFLNIYAVAPTTKNNYTAKITQC